MITILIILAGVGFANALVNEYVFNWLRRILPSWEWLQTLFGCTTCMSFWTTTLIAGIVIQDWTAILYGLAASLIAREITIFEERWDE